MKKNIDLAKVLSKEAYMQMRLMEKRLWTGQNDVSNVKEEQINWTAALLYGAQSIGMVETLEREKKELEQRIAQAERVRDAAVEDLEEIASILDVPACSWCKHEPYEHKHCKECRMKNEGFEWRGVCDENSKEGNE